MPLVIFHVRGKKFRPEIELAKTNLKPYRVHHIGEVIRGDIVFKDSGFCVGIARNNDDLAAQIKVAAKFIKKHFKEIKKLKNADNLCLDFGYCMRFDKDGEPFWVQRNEFSSDFLKMCGDLKINVVLSFYYGFTVDRLISHYVRALKLKRPQQKRAAKK